MEGTGSLRILRFRPDTPFTRTLLFIPCAAFPTLVPVETGIRIHQPGHV